MAPPEPQLHKEKQKRDPKQDSHQPAAAVLAPVNSFTAEELSHWFFQQPFLTHRKKTILFYLLSRSQCMEEAVN